MATPCALRSRTFNGAPVNRGNSGHRLESLTRRVRDLPTPSAANGTTSGGQLTSNLPAGSVLLGSPSSHCCRGCGSVVSWWAWEAPCPLVGAVTVTRWRRETPSRARHALVVLVAIVGLSILLVTRQPVAATVVPSPLLGPKPLPISQARSSTVVVFTGG